MGIYEIILVCFLSAIVGGIIGLFIAGASKTDRETAVYDAGYRRGKAYKIAEADEARHRAFKEGYARGFDQGYIEGISADTDDGK